MLTGDTLFIGDVGRPDLLTSVGRTADSLARELYRSLHEQLLTLPDATLVFPAHGAGSACGKHLATAASSTIGEQRATNYALRPMTVDDFVEAVTEGQGVAPLYFAFAADANRRERGLLDDHEAPEAAHRRRGAAARPRPGAVLLDTAAPESFASGHLRGSDQRRPRRPLRRVRRRRRPPRPAGRAAGRRRPRAPRPRSASPASASTPSPARSPRSSPSSPTAPSSPPPPPGSRPPTWPPGWTRTPTSRSSTSATPASDRRRPRPDGPHPAAAPAPRPPRRARPDRRPPSCTAPAATAPRSRPPRCGPRVRSRRRPHRRLRRLALRHRRRRRPPG